MELFATDLDRLAFLLETDAACYLEDLVAQGVELVTEELPDDLLEYHRATVSPYRGMRGEIVETEEYADSDACARSLVASIRSARGSS